MKTQGARGLRGTVGGVTNNDVQRRAWRDKKKSRVSVWA